jgi:hypothetical protein
MIRCPCPTGWRSDEQARSSRNHQRWQRREWPREYWGWRDWQDEDRLQAKLGADEALPIIPPAPTRAVVTLFTEQRGREVRSAQSRGVDALLKKLGVR